MKKPFKKGPDPRRAKGGKRPGAGRKSKIQKAIEARAEEIAKAFIKRNVLKVLGPYLQLAAGRKVKHHHPQTGKVLWVETEVEPLILKHYMDKLVPPRAPEDKAGKAVPAMIYIHPALEEEED